MFSTLPSVPHRPGFLPGAPDPFWIGIAILIGASLLGGMWYKNKKEKQREENSKVETRVKEELAKAASDNQ
jgi:hypothetical protein|tara:strand:- start:306 stop:518 length:213 start_codon:yes stop_codon:yes gene_type:complete